MTIEEAEGKFIACCENPGCEWRSEPKTEKLGAVRAYAGHQKACPHKGAEAISEKEDAETEKPEWERDLEVIKTILQRYGVSTTLRDRILDSVRTRPQFLSNPFEFKNLLKCQHIKGEETLHLITQNVFEELNPQALSGYSSQGSFEPGASGERGFLTRQSLVQILDERDRGKDNIRLRGEVSDLKAKVDHLEKHGGKGNSDEFWQEREKRLKAENQLAINTAVNNALRNLPPSGRTTLDVIETGLNKLDHRADRMETIFMKKPFNPQVTRTKDERKKMAKSIEQKIEEKEKMLLIENEFIDSCLPVFKGKQS